MRKSALFLLFVFMPLAMLSQRAFKPVKAALKAKNYKEVLQKVAELRKDSIYKDNIKLCLYSLEAIKGLNDAENMKLYLKKNYDTVTFFSTTHQIIKEAVKLDSLEENLREKENRKPKHTHLVCNKLKRYFPNLNAASHYFYLRGKYEDALDYLRTCLELPHTPIGTKAELSTESDIVNSTLYLSSAFLSKNYKEVHRYEALSLQDTIVRPLIIEYLMYTAEAEQDTAAYRHWLQVGWGEYPSKKMFFTRLADYYALQNNNGEVLRMAKQQLAYDSLDTSAFLAQCMALLNLNKYDECIASGRNLLRVDSANVEADYYIGASLVAKAAEIQLPDNALSKSYEKAMQRQCQYYREAEPYLERYREACPNLKNRWAPLLYKIYLALNEGVKFEEIEKFL